MGVYRIFLVGQAKVKPGKFKEATTFWREKGAPDILSEPWTKSLRAYAAQFGLGGDYHIEIWQEIENYAALDAMDNAMLLNPEEFKRKREIWKEAIDYLEWGPTKLMGDWPESSLLPE